MYVCMHVCIYIYMRIYLFAKPLWTPPSHPKAATKAAIQLHQAAPNARGHVVPQIRFEEQLLPGASVEAQHVLSSLVEADHSGLK